MSFGQLTIVLGAGIIASLLPKESLSGVANIFSGALKFVTKQVQSEKDGPATHNPRTATLLSQVNSLQQELRQMVSSRQQTILISPARSGAGKVRVLAFAVVAGALGYGYVRLKGLKLSDLMFVTKRGLSDACTSVGKQLEQVTSSVSATKKHLSSRIDRVDCRLDECREITDATKADVQLMHADISKFQIQMRSVRDVVQILETKLGRLEVSQDFTTRGIHELCLFTNRMEQSGNAELPWTVSGQYNRQASLQALSPRTSMQENESPFARSASLPSPELEPLSPSAAQSPAMETPKILHRSSSILASGLKDMPEVKAGFTVSNPWSFRSSSDVSGASSSPAPRSGSLRVRLPSMNGSSARAG